MFTLEQLSQGQIFLLDKPIKWTSFQVVNKLKWAIINNYNIKKIKIGHAGTLDPLASGLLIVCTGKLTKQIETIQKQPKIYIGEITLGKTTPSYDMETAFDASYPIEHITENKINMATQEFIGEIQQIPPIFSAIKKGGKRLYQYGRKGLKIDIPAKTVYITRFEITEIQIPKLKFIVHCSKGTYIRSLAYDFGKALCTGAYLSSLCRTQIGDFKNTKALNPQETIDKYLSP